MDLITFLTNTIEGKTVSVIGIAAIALVFIFVLVYRFFGSQKDTNDLTKIMLSNQSNLVKVIGEQSVVNHNVSDNIATQTATLTKFSEILDKHVQGISDNTSVLSSIRTQLELDRTFIEAKLGDMANEVAKVISDLFASHAGRNDKTLEEIKMYVQDGGSRLRVGLMTLSGNGDVIFVNDDFIELTGSDSSIVGKNVIKDDVLKIVTQDGTPLVSDASPFYSALSSNIRVDDAIVGIYNPKQDTFVWFLMKIGQTYAMSGQPVYYMVTLSHIGNVVKVIQKHAS